MGLVAIFVAAALAALLIARERIWRRAHVELRARLADTAVHVDEQERRAHLSQVVWGLAQELKSPVQSVLGNTELMLESGTFSQASTDDLREIRESAARAAGILRNLLAFTETHALNRRWQDINDLAVRAADGVRVGGELGAAGVQVTFALADRLPLMHVDGRQLEKVIATLLSRSALPGVRSLLSAAVTLATRLGDTRDRLVIDLDDRAGDVDEPEWSGDLAACRQIVLAHGGTLEVERPDNGGFRFHLELPVTSVGADAATATERSGIAHG